MEIENQNQLRAAEREKEDSRIAYIAKSNQQFQEILKEKEISLVRLEKAFQEQINELKDKHMRDLSDLQAKLDRSEVVLCLEAVIVDITCLTTTEMCDKKLHWISKKHEEKLNYITQSQRGQLTNLTDVQVRSEVSLTLANAVSNVVDTLTTSELEKNRIQRERDQSSQFQLLSQLNQLQQEVQRLDEMERQVRAAQEELEIKAAEIEASRLREEHLLFLSADSESKFLLQNERLQSLADRSLTDSEALTQLQQQISEEQALKLQVLRQLDELKSRETIAIQHTARSPRREQVDCDVQTSAREERSFNEPVLLTQEHQQHVQIHEHDAQINQLQEKLAQLDEVLKLESINKEDILSAGLRKESELLQQIESLTEQCRTLSTDCEQRKVELMNMKMDLSEKSRQLDERAVDLKTSIAEKERAFNALAAEKQQKIDEISAMLVAAESKLNNLPVLVNAESQFDPEIEESCENSTEDMEEEPSNKEVELLEKLRVLQESLNLLTSECDQLVDALTALAEQLSEVTASNAASATEKDALKQFIKDW